jgi:hypothetical protein
MAIHLTFIWLYLDFTTHKHNCVRIMGSSGVTFLYVTFSFNETASTIEIPTANWSSTKQKSSSHLKKNSLLPL